MSSLIEFVKPAILIPATALVPIPAPIGVIIWPTSLYAMYALFILFYKGVKYKALNRKMLYLVLSVVIFRLLLEIHRNTYTSDGKISYYSKSEKFYLYILSVALIAQLAHYYKLPGSLYLVLYILANLTITLTSDILVNTTSAINLIMHMAFGYLFIQYILLFTYLS